jgi:hypothetical protein
VAFLSTILNRILDTAADNLRVAKILIQMGRPSHNVRALPGAELVLAVDH